MNDKPTDTERISVPDAIEEIKGLVIHLLSDNYDFECEAGPLHNCKEWQRMVSLMDLVFTAAQETAAELDAHRSRTGPVFRWEPNDELAVRRHYHRLYVGDIFIGSLQEHFAFPNEWEPVVQGGKAFERVKGIAEAKSALIVAVLKELGMEAADDTLRELADAARAYSNHDEPEGRRVKAALKTVGMEATDATGK